MPIEECNGNWNYMFEFISNQKNFLEDAEYTT